MYICKCMQIYLLIIYIVFFFFLMDNFKPCTGFLCIWDNERPLQIADHLLPLLDVVLAANNLTETEARIGKPQSSMGYFDTWRSTMVSSIPLEPFFDFLCQLGNGTAHFVGLPDEPTSTDHLILGAWPLESTGSKVWTAVGGRPGKKPHGRPRGVTSRLGHGWGLMEFFWAGNWRPEIWLILWQNGGLFKTGTINQPCLERGQATLSICKLRAFC